MAIRGMERSLLSQVLLLAGLCLVCVSIFTAAGYGMTWVLYGINPLEQPDLFTSPDDRSTAALKVIQAFSAIGLFILPPLLFARLVSVKPVQFLQLDRMPDARISGLFIVIIIFSTPLINFLFYLNQQVDLPSALQPLEDWMKSSEEQATRLTEAFLKVTSPFVFLINLLVIAVLPAIGEELLFRGVLQKLFSFLLKNIHVAIAVTAVFFSAFHMQFYGFLPRLLLGLFMGYALVWSGSLWLPILLHLINNGLAVTFSWIAQMKKMPFDQDSIGTEPGDAFLVISSLMLTIGAMVLAQRRSRETGIT